MNSECILCGRELEKGPTENPDNRYDSVIQKCGNCGAYEYWKDEKDKILLLKDEEKANLLRKAKENIKYLHETPKLKFDR